MFKWTVVMGLTTSRFAPDGIAARGGQRLAVGPEKHRAPARQRGHGRHGPPEHLELGLHAGLVCRRHPHQSRLGMPQVEAGPALPACSRWYRARSCSSRL